jgi:Holliday junction resolvase
LKLVNQFLASIPVPVIEQRNVDTIGRRKSRGKSAELELVHLLERYGYGARRSAASGVGGWVAIEVKSSRRAYAIIPKHQMEKIRQDLSFAGKSGIPTFGICAAKFPHCEPPWCFYKLSPDDYQKPFIKIRRGQASNWIPLPKEQLTSEDHFSLEPSKSYSPDF